MDLPEGNTTELDTEALSRLSDHLDTLPLAMLLQDNGLLGNGIFETSLTYVFNVSDNQYRRSRVADYVNM